MKVTNRSRTASKSSDAAQVARQPVDAAGPRQDQRVGARGELEAPEQILGLGVGQGLLQQADEPQHQRIEIGVHLLGAVAGGVIHLGEDAAEIAPALVAR